MKCMSMVCLVLASTSALSLAGFTLPRGVHTVDTLDEARAEAAEDGKGLAFVLSDRKTTCPKCVTASEEAFKKLKRHSVIVYLDSEEVKSWQRVSPMVMTGLQAKEVGNIIPKAAVTSPDMKHLWAQMSYNDLGKDAKFRDTEKSVEALLKGEQQPADPKGMMIYWPVKGSDKHFVGHFQGLKDDDKIVLKMENTGKLANIAMNRLTDESVAFARALAGGGPEQDDAANTAEKEPELEAWTGSNGKVLQARFISLADNSITLQTADGKNHTLPLTRLDAASQEKAKARHDQP